MSKTAIITAAITGAIHTPTMSPYLPLTPEQIISEVIAVYKAGAAVAHIHVRNPETGQPCADQDIFKQIATRVKEKCDIILCTTTGGGFGEPVDRRVKVVSTLQPELASLNAGSLNFALFHIADNYKEWKFDWERPYLESTQNFIFPNTFGTMREFLERFDQVGTIPEFEIYDVGMLNNLAHLIQSGIVREPVYLQFVMGILGGIPATARNLNFLVETARHQIDRFEFSVCAAGKHQFTMGTLSLLMGGHVRVGLEDNLYIKKGVLARSNAEQVEKIMRIASELDIKPASPEEARKILNLKGLENVSF